MPTLYTFANTAAVSSNNFTTLYNTTAQNITPSTGYGNAEVVALLNAGTDGGNTIANIIATGNVTGNYFIGNGSQLTGLPVGYSNAEVSAYLASGTNTGNIITSGNITGNYIFGNGSQLSGLPEIYGNANVAAFLPTYTGNLAGNNIALVGDAVVAGDITAGLDIIAGGDMQASGNIRTTGMSGNITGANYITAQYFVGDGSLLTNITAGNVGTLSNLTVTGNVTASYFLGNGSQLTGLPEVYGNANVATFLADFGSNVVSTTGNVTSGYFIGNGSQLTGLPASYSNANVATFMADFGSNSISTTGNVTASFFAGNGSQLTGMYGDANVAAYLPTYTGNLTANNISTIGNVTIAGNLVSDDITSSGVTVYGDQVITGNLTVQGNTTTINSNVVTTNDKTLTLANNQSTGANVNGAGLEAGNPAIATWLYNDSTTSWQTNIAVTPIGNLLQDLGKSTNRWATVYSDAVNAAGNITGGNVLTGIVSASGNITGGNVLTGIVSASGNITAPYFVGNGYTLTSVNASNVQGNVDSALNASTLRFPVKNTSAGTLLPGTPVYATGTVGATDTLEVSPSRADTAATMAAIGLLETSLAINATGYAISIGALTGLNTNSYTVGQELYVAAAGGLTAVRPTDGNIVQTVGTVGRVNTSTGTVEVNIWNKNSLPNLGSGNIWLGNAAAFPTETTLATYTGTIGAGILTATGNITGGNVLTGGIVSAAGNVTGNYFIGNGSQLTGLPEVYGNANVSNFLANFGSNIVSTTGNITAAYFVGNGSQLTGMYANANVSNFLADYGSNIVSTTGNITAAYFVGNGSLLTGIAASSYGNSNVADFLAAYGANTFSSTGTITAGNITGGNVLTGGILSATGNVNAGNVLTGGIVSATGNITANYFIGNGSQLTGITASASLSGNLAGDIYANGYSFTSLANGNVIITANGTGTVQTSKQKMSTFAETVYAMGNVTGNLAANIDINNGSIQTMTLTGNITANSVQNMVAGQSVVLIMSQDATGNRILTSTMKWSGAFKTLSTSASTTDIATIFYDGTNYWASLSRGYA